MPLTEQPRTRTKSLIDELFASSRRHKKKQLDPDPYILSTDELVEGLDALEIVAEQLSMVLNNPQRWKWAILAMDNALTVLLAWAVRHSSGFNVLEFGKGANGDRKRNQWIDAMNGVEIDGKRVKYPSVPMKNLHGLLQEACSGHVQYVGAENLRLTDLQKRSINYVHRLRNRFQHFEPCSWTVFPFELPLAFREIVSVIAFLMDRRAPFKLFRASGDMKPRASRALQRVLLELDAIEEVFERFHRKPKARSRRRLPASPASPALEEAV